MNDLMTRVSAANPVPTATLTDAELFAWIVAQPADPVSSAPANPAGRVTRSTSRVWQSVRSHRLLSAVAVALVIAGCAAVAASVSGTDQRLELGLTVCVYGTSPVLQSNYTDVMGGAKLSGSESPQAACRPVFAKTLKAFGPVFDHKQGWDRFHDPRLITCRWNSFELAVLIASGKANQCQRAGLAPLPRNFNVESVSTAVQSLEAALRSLLLRRKCWAPRAFANAVAAILANHGLTDWHVTWSSSRHGPTGCAVFDPSNPTNASPYPSFDPYHRIFTFGLGVPRSDG